MLRTHTVHIASSTEEHLYRGLADATSVSSDPRELRVIGGLMARLITDSYPVPDHKRRPTSDADVVASLELAASGRIHERLTALGYFNAQTENAYVTVDPSIEQPTIGDIQKKIEILVPAEPEGEPRIRPARPHRRVLGGRGFTATPESSIALSSGHILHEVEAVSIDGEVIASFTAPTPDVQTAVLLKATVAVQRREENHGQDVHDLIALLGVVDHYRRVPDEIGGWKPKALGIPVRLRAVQLRIKRGEIPIDRADARIFDRLVRRTLERPSLASIAEPFLPSRSAVRPAPRAVESEQKLAEQRRRFPELRDMKLDPHGRSDETPAQRNDPQLG